MMVDFQSPGQILFPGLPVPPRAMIGLSEQIDPLGEYDTDRSLHGTLLLLRPAWSPTGDLLYKIRLSGSGDGAIKPSMDDLLPGTDVVYYSVDWWTRTIPAGALTTTLRRDPVPGSVVGGDPRQLNPDRVAVAVADRVVTLAGPLAYALTIYYRPAFHCTVTSHSTSSNERTGKSRGYGLTLEERVPS